MSKKVWVSEIGKEGWANCMETGGMGHSRGRLTWILQDASDFAKLKRDKSSLQIRAEVSQIHGHVGSGHETCPTGASQILGNLLLSLEVKYKKSVMEGWKMERLVPSRCVCDGWRMQWIGKGPLEKVTFEHSSCNKPFQTGLALL